MNIAAHNVGLNGAKKARTGTSLSFEIPKRLTPEKKNGVENSTAEDLEDRICFKRKQVVHVFVEKVVFVVQLNYRKRSKTEVSSPRN